MTEVIVQFTDACTYDNQEIQKGKQAIYSEGFIFCDLICYQAYLREISYIKDLKITAKAKQ